MLEEVRAEEVIENPASASFRFRYKVFRWFKSDKIYAWDVVGTQEGPIVATYVNDNVARMWFGDLAGFGHQLKKGFPHCRTDA